MKPATSAGRIPLWLLLVAVLVGGSVLFLLYPQPNNGAGGGAGAGNFEDETPSWVDGGPQAGEFEGPAPTPQSSTEQERLMGPPDRVYVGSGASEATIRGRVLLTPGQNWPSGAVSLELREQGAKTALEYRGVLAEQPGFEFRKVPFGSYRLSVNADGCQDYSVLLTLTADAPDVYQQLVLAPDAKVIGRVMDTGGKPVEGVTITVIPFTDPPRGGIPKLGRTEADGTYSVGGLAPGDYEVFAGTLRYPQSDAKRILISETAREGWAELEVSPVGSALITVLDEAGGHDLSPVRIQATLRAEPGERGYSVGLPVDEEGKALFEGLPPGDYAFQAYGGDFRRTSRNLAVSADAVAELSISLLPFRKPE